MLYNVEFKIAAVNQFQLLARILQANACAVHFLDHRIGDFKLQLIAVEHGNVNVDEPFAVGL